MLNVLEKLSAAAASLEAGRNLLTNFGAQGVKGMMQIADDLAQASAKAGSKSAGLIAANTAFLMVVCIDLAFMVRDLIKNKGSEAAEYLRRKAK